MHMTRVLWSSLLRWQVALSTPCPMSNLSRLPVETAGDLYVSDDRRKARVRAKICQIISSGRLRLGGGNCASMAFSSSGVSVISRAR